MAYVRLGTVTNRLVEFLVFDDEDKQKAAIYCSKGYRSNHGHCTEWMDHNIVGDKDYVKNEINITQLENIANKELCYICK